MDNIPPYRGHCMGLIRKLKSPESNYLKAKCRECVILDIHDAMGAFCNPKSKLGAESCVVGYIL